MEGERRGVGSGGGADFGLAMGRRHRSDGCRHRRRPWVGRWEAMRVPPESSTRANTGQGGVSSSKNKYIKTYKFGQSPTHMARIGIGLAHNMLQNL